MEGYTNRQLKLLLFYLLYFFHFKLKSPLGDLDARLFAKSRRLLIPTLTTYHLLLTTINCPYPIPLTSQQLQDAFITG